MEGARVFEQLCAELDVPYYQIGKLVVALTRGGDSRPAQPIEVQARLVEEDAEYGHLICRCEMVTRREVIDAIQNPLGVRTITGIKLRSRAMVGRRQGGFCSTRIVDMLSSEYDTPLTDITLKGPGSDLFVGTTKDLRKHEN